MQKNRKIFTHRRVAKRRISGLEPPPRDQLQSEHGAQLGGHGHTEELNDLTVQVDAMRVVVIGIRCVAGGTGGDGAVNS